MGVKETNRKDKRVQTITIGNHSKNEVNNIEVEILKTKNIKEK